MFNGDARKHDVATADDDDDECGLTCNHGNVRAKQGKLIAVDGIAFIIVMSVNDFSRV